MTDLLDFVRRIGRGCRRNHVGLGNPAASHRAAVGGNAGRCWPATLIGRTAAPGLDAVAGRHAADSAVLIGFFPPGNGPSCRSRSIAAAGDSSRRERHARRNSGSCRVIRAVLPHAPAGEPFEVRNCRHRQSRSRRRSREHVPTCASARRGSIDVVLAGVLCRRLGLGDFFGSCLAGDRRCGSLVCRPACPTRRRFALASNLAAIARLRAVSVVRSQSGSARKCRFR